MRHSVHQRRGFTLLQLAVVVFIFIVLGGLLIVKVELMRGTSARMRCANTMRQIGLACQNYAEANSGVVPGGSIVGSAKVPADRLGVFVTLLPYLEQDLLYKKFDLKRGWADQEKEARDELRCQIFWKCPVDPSDSRKNTNYVAVAGIDPGAANLALKRERAGTFGFDRIVRIEDIVDGSSNTLLLLESHPSVGPWTAAKATLRGIDPDDETPVGQGRAFGVDHGLGEWCWRVKPGECIATMADGTVRELKATISAEVLSALATIAGGEDVPTEW